MMEKKSEGNFNHAIKELFSSIPDPLHFEMPHGHKKLLELLYIISVATALILILGLGNMGVLSVQETNASAMLILILSIFLAIMIIEKSLVHKPLKHSS
jgi:hypothetical protein